MNSRISAGFSWSRVPVARWSALITRASSVCTTPSCSHLTMRGMPNMTAISPKAAPAECTRTSAEPGRPSWANMPLSTTAKLACFDLAHVTTCPGSYRVGTKWLTAWSMWRSSKPLKRGEARTCVSSSMRASGD